MSIAGERVKLFFNYSLDCELPPNTPYTEGAERRTFFHGPATWRLAEASVRGFIGQMGRLGVGEGATLFVYPDVAQEQNHLYRELADTGVEIALHLNGLRYSRLTAGRAKWLGAMPRDEQRDALRMAKHDLEDAIGKPCLGYRACYGSANDDTFPICEELGFQWSSNASSRYRMEFHANWSGSWPYPRHAHRNSKLIPGDLRLYEIPVTSGRSIFYDGDPGQPLDLRVESLPSKLGEDRHQLRKVIEENIIEMERRNVPVRAIIGASHNTNPFGNAATHQAQNLDWIVRHAHELTVKRGCEFVPAAFGDIRAEAERIGAW